MIEMGYKNQLETLIHAMRSPLVTLSIASDGVLSLYEEKHITVSASKLDEYTESLNLIRASIKRLNNALRSAEEGMLIVNQEEV